MRDKPCNEPRRFVKIRKKRVLLATSALLVGLFILHFTIYGQDKSGFPDGFDAVQAAPKSHKVIFENAFVRVLEVSVLPNTTVPMHHHRWPSFFITWDTGGKTSHLRFHKPDGSVQDQPSVTTPVHPGVWKIRWSEPEPMRSMEIVENNENTSGPTLLRIEIKCHP